MLNQMYFGTKNYMQWIPACAINPDFSKVGWSNSQQFLNGGASVRTSSGSHREYQMAWNSISRDKARSITDYADGLFDATDQELIYFLDPMAMDKNVVPQIIASPIQGMTDGFDALHGTNPTIVATPANSNGYPTRSVRYDSILGDSGFPLEILWIPIPTGYTAWIGMHGTIVDTSGTTPYNLTSYKNGVRSGVVTSGAVLPVTSTTRFNAHVDSSSSTDSVGLQFLSAGSFTLSGLMIQILPTGVTPSTGGFISGQGNSGCQFASQPLITPRSAALDKVSLSCKLIETGSWL